MSDLLENSNVRPNLSGFEQNKVLVKEASLNKFGQKKGGGRVRRLNGSQTTAVHT